MASATDTRERTRAGHHAAADGRAVGRHRGSQVSGGGALGPSAHGNGPGPWFRRRPEGLHPFAISADQHREKITSAHGGRRGEGERVVHVRRVLHQPDDLIGGIAERHLVSDGCREQARDVVGESDLPERCG